MGKNVQSELIFFRKHINPELIGKASTHLYLNKNVKGETLEPIYRLTNQILYIRWQA